MEHVERKYGVTDVMTVFGLKDKYCKDFNPRTSYRSTKNTEKVLTKSDKGHGVLTGRAYRLVQDMMERGATTKELQRAVRYLWVCIDAVKYRLDYRRAAKELGINELSARYGRNGMRIY